MLASIDRCLLTSSSIRWRNWSKIKIARRFVAISIIFWFISPAHMLVFYDFYTSTAGVPNTCSSGPSVYSIFVSGFFVVWLTAIPYTVMLISGIITFMHIQASRHRVIPFQQQRQPAIHRRIDRHLMIMMFLQAILSVILLSMHTVVLSYQLLTRDVPKDSTRLAIESFISQFGIVLYYINYAKSFYLYTLTSPLFREVFWKQICQFWNYVRPARGNITAVHTAPIAIMNKRLTKDAMQS